MEIENGSDIVGVELGVILRRDWYVKIKGFYFIWSINGVTIVFGLESIIIYVVFF